MTKRAEGYYWVNPNAGSGWAWGSGGYVWTMGWWDGEGWSLTGSANVFADEDMDEIDEHRVDGPGVEEKDDGKA